MPLSVEPTLPTAAEVVVIETNNFHQVLQHFDNRGILKNNHTCFRIECQICTEMHLGLTNTETDDPNEDIYEEYTVLPRCGHGFGYECLYQWMNTDYNRNPPCPSCRTPILCEELRDMDLPIYGTRNSHDQAKQITQIRDSLAKETCTGCQGPQRQVNGQQPGRSNQDRLQAIQARREAIRGRMQVGTTAENQNRETYEVIEHNLSIMHSMIAIANQRGGPGGDTLEIWFAQDNVQEGLNRQWELGEIERQVSRIEDMAEGRITRQRQRAEAAQRIMAQMATLHAELQQSVYI
ncbi:hypothetical protein GGR51DRAFT_565959 [Nemania sp. FL0031]|nr:hypothetical protein GGR51DRAFT_565959 [Nemania sp. FL0031]